MIESKIYCGSGKIGKFDIVNGSICLDDIPAKFKRQSKNGKTYVNINICPKREVDQYGKSHYIIVDQWEPQQQNNQQPQQAEKDTDFGGF